MLFCFTGTYTGGRTSITLFGVTFEGREPVDVTDPDGIRRLSNHPEFEAVGSAPETRDEWVDRFDAELIAAALSTAATPIPKPRGRPKKAKP